MRFWLVFISVIVSGCSINRSSEYRSYTAAISNGEPPVINDRQIRADAEKKLNELMKDNEDFTPHETLVGQLSRESSSVYLKPTGILTMTPAEIYKSRINSVVLIGSVNHCSSAKCHKNHFNPASGVIIHENGVVLTNYHVVKSKMEKLITMAACTFDGQVFLVDEVLAADELNDVAIVKLKNASRLDAAPVFRDEPVGNPVTLITHPVGSFYTLTQGYISRYLVGKDGRYIMNITADYAKGSSGGPLFNDRGDVVGLVSSTRSVTYTNVPLATDPESNALMMKKKGTKPAEFQGFPLALSMNHQMTFKNTVPSRSILNLIKD